MSPGNSANNLFSKVLLPEPDGPAKTSGRQPAVQYKAIKISYNTTNPPDESDLFILADEYAILLQRGFSRLP